MKTIKQAGIFLDHSSAHIMSIIDSRISSTRIESSMTTEKKQSALGKNENLMHNKEQHEQNAYYKQIAKLILKYNEVLLFGPANAKRELLNLLKADQKFALIKIEVLDSDKLTENQQHAFVKNYFKIE